MKNRIWKKLGALGMAFFMTGMVLGGSVTCKAVYADEEAVLCEETDQSEERSFISDTESAGDAYKIVEDEYKNTEYVENATADEETDVEKEEDISESPGETEQGDPKDTDEGQGEEGISDGSEDDMKDIQKKCEMKLNADAGEESVKAGSDLVYTVTLENTGDILLKNIQINYQSEQKSLSGEWSEGQEDQAVSAGNTVHIEQLECGMKKQLYLTLKLPEEQEEAVSVKFIATAESDEKEAEPLVKESVTETKVIPLKASFEVTKSADRSVAVPGDKILFQICIRNTGERTLHSVITTERFQLGNVPVQFLEKEGVVLNKAKTKARIEKIEPGKAAGLQAMVTLPENIKEQELLNEVTVTTLETGDQTVVSQAKIQVKASEEKADSAENDSVDTENVGTSHAGESYPVSTHPKTGDPYRPFLWLAMIPGSLLAAGWIRSRM